MKNFDPKVAARVWERVQNQEPAPDSQSLLTLIVQEQQEAAILRSLSRRLPPTQANLARQLARQDQSHAACLAGIYTMLTGQRPPLPPAMGQDSSAGRELRSCYNRKTGCLAQYESRRTDPMYGHIFRSLAREEQEHCRRLLEIMGETAK